LIDIYFTKGRGEDNVCYAEFFCVFDPYWSNVFDVMVRLLIFVLCLVECLEARGGAVD
jgi:hypothetical protein